MKCNEVKVLNCTKIYFVTSQSTSKTKYFIIIQLKVLEKLLKYSNALLLLRYFKTLRRVYTRIHYYVTWPVSKVDQWHCRLLLFCLQTNTLPLIKTGHVTWIVDVYNAWRLKLRFKRRQEKVSTTNRYIEGQTIIINLHVQWVLNFWWLFCCEQ